MNLIYFFVEICLRMTCKLNKCLEIEGIPTLAYGIMGYFMVKHVETVHTHKGDVKIYFLIKENKESIY